MFRVEGQGSRFWDLGSRVEGLGSGVWVESFREAESRA